MARNLPPRREEFDPNRVFFVKRPLRVNGRDWAPDPATPFDKSLVTTRTLRQLYDQRRLDMGSVVTNGVVGPNGGSSRSAYLADLSVSQLREWLVLRGKVPRRNATREQLLVRIEQVLSEDARSM